MTGSRRRRVVVWVAALVTVLATARLGAWQLDRAAQKLALQHAIDERGTLPRLGAKDLSVDARSAAELHHRPVALRGRWLAEHTLCLDNRPMSGRVGFIVVTPLQLDPAPGVVLVQRGWIPRDARDRTLLVPYRTPAGNVEVTGRLAGAPSSLYEFAGAQAGPIRQNLELDGVAREFSLPLLPLTVAEFDAPFNRGDGLLREWPRPAVDVHKHYGYAAQWFALAALVAGLTVWFQLIQPRLGRAR